MQQVDKPHAQFYSKIISKNFKLNSFLNISSKLAFLTCFMVLSKVVEPSELHIMLNYKVHGIDG